MEQFNRGMVMALQILSEAYYGERVYFYQFDRGDVYSGISEKDMGSTAAVNEFAEKLREVAERGKK